MKNVLQSIKQEPAVYLFGRVWKYSKGNHFRFCMAIIFLIVGSLIIALEPIVIAKIVNTVQLEGVTNNNLLSLAGLAALIPCLMLTQQAFGWVGYYLRTQVKLDMGNEYRKELITKIFARPAEWLDARDSGSLIDKTNTAAYSLMAFVGRYPKFKTTFLNFFDCNVFADFGQTPAVNSSVSNESFWYCSS